MSYNISEGMHYPLGATVCDNGINFALFSSSCKQVYLCIYDEHGKNEIQRIELKHNTNSIWHVFVEGLPEFTRYGYRVHGEYNPNDGLRFNAHKLLIDPYARLIDRPLKVHDSMFAYNVSNKNDNDLSFNKTDSADFMPKCVALREEPDLDSSNFPRYKPKESIIYEAHVKNLTQLCPEIPLENRGKFLGLTHPRIINHLKDLGVTSIELMPIHLYLSERYHQNRGLTNHWGYNSINFFCSDTRYYNHYNDIKELVRILHEEGFEVILDVVYNHTGEGDQLGPTVSFKGIDNLYYYHTLPHSRRHYMNDTGCGNSLNAHNPHVLQMIMDSLRFWTNKIGIDGYRFDLATTLLRDSSGRVDLSSTFLHTIAQDPSLMRCKLIAEPWDIGINGYQVGGFTKDWSEWNDKYRDNVRRFWISSPEATPNLASRICGSADIFAWRDRSLYSSMNFITAHDGFCLQDLVSYNLKYNLANGEANRDGHNNNHSWNCGVEGETHITEVNELRLRQKKNLFATMMLSLGIPMVLAGDEMGNTQQGNNNAYCQDNEISWIDWANLKEPNNQDFLEFCQYVIKLRKQIPLIKNEKFFDNSIPLNNNIKRITWLHNLGHELTGNDWNDPNLRDLLLLFNEYDNLDPNSKDEAKLYGICFNASKTSKSFNLNYLTTQLKAKKFIQVLDTTNKVYQQQTKDKIPDYITLKCHSLLVFKIE